MVTVPGGSAAAKHRALEKKLRGFLGKEPFSQRVLYALLDLLLGQRKEGEAAAVLEESLERVGWEAHLARILGDNPKSLCWQLGRILEKFDGRGEEKTLEVLVRACSADKEKLILLIDRLSDLGRTEWAKRLLLEHGDRSPDRFDIHLKLAATYGGKGAWAEAVPLLRRAIALSPERVEGRLRLAHALIRQGLLAEAEEALVKVPPSHDAAYEVLFARARLLASQDKLEEATLYYERACAARPERLETYLFLVETLMQRRAVDELFAVLRRAKAACPEPGPEDIEGMVDRHRAMVFLCDGAEVARIGEEILDKTRRTEFIDVLRMGALVPEFDLTFAGIEYKRAALKIWDGFIAERPDTPWGYFYRSLILAYHDEAVFVGDNQLRRADQDRFSGFPVERYGWMRLERGKERLYAGDFAAAMQDFEALIGSTDGGNWTAQCYVGETLFFQGDLPGALQAFEKGAAMAPDPDKGWALAWEGQILNWSGRYEQALPILGEAISRSGQYALGWKGAALLKLGRAEEALEWLERAVAISPWDDEESVAWYCEALYRLRRFDDALKVADEALNVKTMSNFYIHVVRGLVRGERGRVGEMREDIGRVPKDVLEYVSRKTGLRSDGAPAQAQDLLRKILELSGGVRRPGFYQRAWMR